MAIRIERFDFGADPQEADPELLGRVVDGEISDEQLLDLYPAEYWERLPEEWFEMILSGPVTFAIIEDDPDPIDDPVDTDAVDPNAYDPSTPVPIDELDEFIEEELDDIPFDELVQ